MIINRQFYDARYMERPPLSGEKLRAMHNGANVIDAVLVSLRIRAQVAGGQLLPGEAQYLIRVQPGTRLDSITNPRVTGAISRQFGGARVHAFQSGVMVTVGVSKLN